MRIYKIKPNPTPTPTPQEKKTNPIPHLLQAQSAFALLFILPFTPVLPQNKAYTNAQME